MRHLRRAIRRNLTATPATEVIDLTLSPEASTVPATTFKFHAHRAQSVPAPIPDNSTVSNVPLLFQEFSLSDFTSATVVETHNPPVDLVLPVEFGFTTLFELDSALKLGQSFVNTCAFPSPTLSITDERLLTRTTPPSRRTFTDLLPLETWTEIAQYLDPLECFRLASHLRVRHLYRIALPRIPAASPDKASERGQIDLLQWWKDSSLSLHYTKDSIERACSLGNITVLSWWEQSGLTLRYSTRAMQYASQRSNFAVWNWWCRSGLDLRYCTRLIDGLSMLGNVAALEWWKNSGLELKYTTRAMDLAEGPDTLQWWRQSGLTLQFSVNGTGLRNALVHQDRETAAWWMESGLLAMEVVESYN